MDARTEPEQPDDESTQPLDDAEEPDETVHTPRKRGRRASPPLEGLGIAGLTRRRVAWLMALAITAWIVVVFARQVGDASAKAAEADAARGSNTSLAAEVSSLERELALVQRQEFIIQRAHGLGLGTARDHPFALAGDAPALAANAPGSAAVRLGARPTESSPLESWLSLLFGPAPSN
jgi:hypothetical protein